MKNKAFLFLPILFLAAQAIAQTGTLDPSFGQNGRVTVGFDGTGDAQDPTAVAMQPDGKILVAGFGFHLPGVAKAHICIVRLLPNGEPDPDFSGDGKAGFVLDTAAQFNIPREMKVLDNGKILLLATAGNDLYFLRLLANGDPDPAFGTAGALKIARPLAASPVFFTNHGLLLQSNGKILTFYRQTYTTLGATIQVVSRFNANGSPDNTLGGTGRVVVDSSIVATGQHGAFTNGHIALISGNKILLVGDTMVQVSPSILLVKLIRLNTDGSFDQSFGPGGAITFPSTNMVTNGVQLDANQNILVGGMIGGNNAALRIKPNGLLDLTYGTNGVAIGGATNFIMIDAGLLLSNGNTVLGGISNATGFFQTMTKSFGSQGLLNASYGVGGISAIPQLGEENILRAMEVQADGKVILVGKRKAVSNINVSDFEVMRLNATTSPVQEVFREEDFQIWPNPVGDFLHISLVYMPQGTTLSLYSADGKWLRSQFATEGKQEIDLKSLPAGNYFLRANVPGQVPVTKVVVKSN